MANRGIAAGLDHGDNMNWYFCFGHCPTIDVYLKERTGKLWILPKFMNALFRTVGQVVFANNPFSGLIILTAIFLYSSIVGLAVLTSATIAILTAVVIRQDPNIVSSGLLTFNAVLVASVTTSLWTPLYKHPMDMKLWIFILTGSSFSVLLSNGLMNILSSFKPTIPILSTPFHILAFVTFASLKPSLEDGNELRSGHVNVSSAGLYKHTLMLPDSEHFLKNFNNTPSPLEFYSWQNAQNVLLAITFSSGQVFGFVHLFGSLLVYSAVLMYSPILTFMSLMGATVGTVIGLLLTPFPNDEVFLCVWGFNGFLAGGAISIFYIFNCYSAIIGIANAIFAAILQLSITKTFVASRMPVFGLPFILSTIIFVSINSRGEYLVRASEVTFPEMQRKRFHQQREHDEEAETGIKLVRDE